MFKFIFEISLLLLLSVLNPKISEGACAEHDVTQEGSHEQT